MLNIANTNKEYGRVSLRDLGNEALFNGDHLTSRLIFCLNSLLDRSGYCVRQSMRLFVFPKEVIPQTTHQPYLVLISPKPSRSRSDKCDVCSCGKFATILSGTCCIY
jgi:hypothetical protein